MAVGLGAEWSQFGWSDRRAWVPDVLTGWVLIAGGLIGWSRRPSSRSGALLAAAGFAWFAPNFATSGIDVLAWFAGHGLYLHRGPLVALVLTFPRGRATSRLELTAVVAGYAAAVITPVWRNDIAAMVLAVVMLLVAVRAYRHAVGAERRMRRGAVRATIAFAVLLIAIAAVRLAVTAHAITVGTLHAYQTGLCVLSCGVVMSLFRASWARAEVTDLVVELGEGRSASVREALARALGDPTLQLGYWRAEASGFVDADGRVLSLPDEDGGRSMTLVERDGAPIAVLVHDAAVLEDAGLREAVASAARLAAANAQLRDQVRARLTDLAASRRRIVDAGDDERGRLERRLREGAQRRLDQADATLRDAKRTATGADTTDRIDRAANQLTHGQEELTRFGRGIHPHELSELGLGGALAALAHDFPLAVELAVDEPTTSARAKTCAFFVCSEALANVAKYAAASRVRIAVRMDARGLIVEVTDDGVGGADAARGTGLRGLTDRVQTLGGTLSVTSPRGGGTRLCAVIPRT